MAKSSTKKSKVKVKSLNKETKPLSEKEMKKIKGGSTQQGVAKKNLSSDGEGYGIGG